METKETNTVQLNCNELKVYNKCVEVSQESDNIMFIFEDILSLKMSREQINGYLSQLEQKKLIEKLDNCYYDFEVKTDKNIMIF